jgi:ankyrin repeat protein
MSEAFRLPPSPNLEQYKKLAKDLQSACKSSDADAVRGCIEAWVEKMAPQETARIEQRWLEFKKSSPCTLTRAQLFIAREHGFASWPKFAKHLAALALARSPVSNFEAAADAIAVGDVAALAKLLHDDAELARARSTREHRSTLLHYVSANGIEDFRQKTPKNIVEIAKLLVKAGADVNAESDAYGGGSTALLLTATSVHPEAAGVQIPLMEFLIDHGARIDGVNACLRNGRGLAADFLASTGAPLDLEGACGVGRLDEVKNLLAVGSSKQMEDGFGWACEFGRTDVVEFLLQNGHCGPTGLHWAAYGGHADIVRLLLQHGTPVDSKDDRYDGTPLEWAFHGCGNSAEKRGRYYEVVKLLVDAGAKADPQPLS